MPNKNKATTQTIIKAIAFFLSKFQDATASINGEMGNNNISKATVKNL